MTFPQVEPGEGGGAVSTGEALTGLSGDVQSGVSLEVFLRSLSVKGQTTDGKRRNRLAGTTDRNGIVMVGLRRSGAWVMLTEQVGVIGANLSHPHAW
jgi:hypothetical protein